MIKIVSNEQMREMDKHTIQSLGVPGLILMENAGRETFEYICDFLADTNLSGRIDIYCGKGNNGGDGYVIARHLFLAGYPVQILSIGNPESLSADAGTNYRICLKFSIPVTVIESTEQLAKSTAPALIVDALLGTGIKGAASGLMAEVINHINNLDVPVVSVDIPSGLNGDSPALIGPCITADLTVTMALPKYAHIFYPAKSKAGQIETAEIGIPASVKQNPQILLNLSELSDLYIPHLSDSAHKYSNGKLFILAGSTGMTGAAALAGQAALRSGIGLLNIGIPESLNPVMEVKITEGLTIPLPETKSGTVSLKALEEIRNRIDWADAVVIGPGSGRDEETQNCLISAIKYCNEINKPALLDADALFALSVNQEIMKNLGAYFLLTPHYGEYKQLTGFNIDEIEENPWRCLRATLHDKAFVINLKGAPSMVASPDGQVYVNPTGNQGLAKGGSGDVLAGIIGGLMARGVEPIKAAITGNYLHGECADRLLETHGVHTFLPSDLIRTLPEILNLYSS